MQGLIQPRYSPARSAIPCWNIIGEVCDKFSACLKYLPKNWCQLSDYNAFRFEEQGSRCNYTKDLRTYISGLVAYLHCRCLCAPVTNLSNKKIFMTQFNMSLVSMCNNNNLSVRAEYQEVQQNMNEFPDIWRDELGRFNKYEVHLHLKENTTPKFLSHAKYRLL